MTMEEALKEASKALASLSTEDAPLEAELLLMHILGIDRARLYIRLEDELSSRDEEAYSQLVIRRLSHEPIAYILGHREFFGHDFHVAPGVLIPRAESELLVEMALDFARSEFPHQNPVIADIGTGSGAIAISLALLLPGARIYATDISSRALEIARVNCERHAVTDRVLLLQGAMLHPLPEAVDIIVANPPYVEDEELEKLSAEIRLFEPVEALLGGRDGLDKVRQLLAEAGGKLSPRGLLLVEIGAGQGEAAASWARKLYPRARVELARDLSGWERVLGVRLVDGD